MKAEFWRWEIPCKEAGQGGWGQVTGDRAWGTAELLEEATGKRGHGRFHTEECQYPHIGTYAGWPDGAQGKARGTREGPYTTRVTDDSIWTRALGAKVQTH